MKQGTLITRVVMLLLFAGVSAYFLVSVWNGLDERAYTVTTYTHTVDDAAEATGLLVRQEEVVPGQVSGIVDILPDQGEKVSAGEAVAYLYRDESALGRKRELRALELELDQLKYALQQGDAGWDNARLDQSIVDAMVGLRASAAYGDLTGLEDQTLTFKSLVIRRGYSLGESAAHIGETAAALEQQVAALKSTAALDTTPVRAPRSGCFSALADGYESLIAPQGLDALTVSGLDRLMALKPEAPAAVGKLITSSTWYFTASLPDQAAQRLIEGRAVRVRFSRDWSGEVSMTVERVGDSEDGRRLVVLSAARSLADTSLLRKQTVDIVFQSTTGIRVPKRAVRDELRTETVRTTDEATGETVRTESTRRATGVYVLTGGQAEFKEVDILADDGDHYLVAAVTPENPSDSQIKKALRAGDEVIVTAEEIYDGKVMDL